MATTELTAQNFASTLKDSGLLLIDWWAPWCGPCRAFGPVYERVAAKHPEVTFGKVNTESEPALAAQFKIQAIPTLMVIRDGVLLFEQAGMLPEAALVSLIDQAQKLDMAEVKAKVAEEQTTTKKAANA